MVKDATFLWAVIQCAHTGTLQNIVTDEAHLFAIHNTSFRVEIRILRTLFYKLVFCARYHEAHLFVIHDTSFRVEIRILRMLFYKSVFCVRYHPVFIALAATMSERNLQYFVDLTSIYFLPAS